MLPDFTQIVERLAAVPPPLEPVPSKRAAVVMSLRLGLQGPELLMIQRAVRAGDPWSGHMGFPGGRRDATDDSDIACAKRETHEEIGVDLDVYGQLICQLSDVNTGWRADRPEMLVAPFVYNMVETPTFDLNHEVDDTLWVPLDFLLDETNRGRHQWDWRGDVLESDAFSYDGRLIWGLSLLMIDELLTIISGRNTASVPVNRA